MMSQFYNNAKTFALLGLMTALILWIGTFFHNGIYIAMIFAAISNVVA